MYSEYNIREGAYFASVESVVKHRLPNGVYTAGVDEWGSIYFRPFVPITDELIEFKDSLSEQIVKMVDHFLSQEVKDAFTKYNIVYKRGVLLYGMPGTGKTSVVNLIMQTAAKKDMVILYNIPPNLVNASVDAIRAVEKNNRKIMVIWEDFEDIVTNYERDILNLLDGIVQVEDIFYIATTNFLDEIPNRVKKRPSRFADIIEVGTPPAELRRKYILSKLHPEDNIDINFWVEHTEGFTIDQLKDLVINVLVLGMDIDKAIEKSREAFTYFEEDENERNIKWKEERDPVPVPIPIAPKNTTRREGGPF